MTSCRLTAFLGYKAGMTHIVRDVEKPGSSEFPYHICVSCMKRSIGETGLLQFFALFAYVKMFRANYLFGLTIPSFLF